MDRQRAFVEFCAAQVRLEDDRKTLPCRVDPEFFYPEDYFEQIAKELSERVAKILCDTCPLKTLCQTYAVAAQEDYGIWGGTNSRERREIRLKLNRPKSDQT